MLSFGDVGKQGASLLLGAGAGEETAEEDEAVAEAVVTPEKKGEDDKDSIRVARDFLKGDFRWELLPGDSSVKGRETINRLISKNQGHLRDWDIRFAHLDRLLDLYEFLTDSGKHDLTEFVEARLKALEQETALSSPRKNVLAGAFLTVSVFVIASVFRMLEPHLTALVTQRIP